MRRVPNLLVRYPGSGMQHNVDLLLTLTGGLSAALALGLVTQQLRLSPIVGYLLAGVLVGPFTPGFVAHAGIAEQLAELGVILLMFGVGLHFHLRELLAVRGVAIPGALTQIAVATGLGLWLAHVQGWTSGAGLVFGLAISVASTVVLLRMLSDNDALHTAPGHIAVGWLVVEDVFTVFALVLLPVLVGRGATASGKDVAWAVGNAVLRVGGLVGFTFIVGRRLIPKLLEYVAKTRSRELFTLTVLVLALGISVGASLLFGVSMALGAFLAGMVVGQSDFSSRAASDALPMRDAFAVLFFVSMGMLFDPTRLLADVWLTLGTIGIVLVAKPLAALAVVLLLRRPMRTALLVAVALGQIGDVSARSRTAAQRRCARDRDRRSRSRVGDGRACANWLRRDRRTARSRARPRADGVVAARQARRGSQLCVARRELAPCARVRPASGRSETHPPGHPRWTYMAPSIRAAGWRTTPGCGSLNVSRHRRVRSFANFDEIYPYLRGLAGRATDCVQRWQLGDGFRRSRGDRLRRRRHEPQRCGRDSSRDRWNACRR